MCVHVNNIECTCTCTAKIMMAAYTALTNNKQNFVLLNCKLYNYGKVICFVTVYNSYIVSQSVSESCVVHCSVKSVYGTPTDIQIYGCDVIVSHSES